MGPVVAAALADRARDAIDTSAEERAAHRSCPGHLMTDESDGALLARRTNANVGEEFRITRELRRRFLREAYGA